MSFCTFNHPFVTELIQRIESLNVIIQITDYLPFSWVGSGRSISLPGIISLTTLFRGREGTHKWAYPQHGPLMSVCFQSRMEKERKTYQWCWNCDFKYCNNVRMNTCNCQRTTMKFPNLETPPSRLKDRKSTINAPKQKELLPCICSQNES